MEGECPESVTLRAAVQDKSFLRTLAAVGEMLGPRPREALCETLQYNDLCDFFEANAYIVGESAVNAPVPERVQDCTCFGEPYSAVTNVLLRLSEIITNRIEREHGLSVRVL